MHNTLNGVLTDAERFAHVESLIARYPAITDDQVEDLKRWFDKEASAFDVATLASKEAIHSSYMAFRRKHVKPHEVSMSPNAQMKTLGIRLDWS